MFGDHTQLCCIRSSNANIHSFFVPGTDTLFVTGTELDDSYVVKEGKVFGGGLSINFQAIENLELDLKEGNDYVAVLSTSPTLSTALYGNKGSDTFEVCSIQIESMSTISFLLCTNILLFWVLSLQICPRDVDPVTSRNLRGHRGIVEHEISSGDQEYDGLRIAGVAVDVFDNDGEYGWMAFVANEANYLLFEDDTSHTFTFTGIQVFFSMLKSIRFLHGSFLTSSSSSSFFLFCPVFPTRPPNGKVVVEINAQSDAGMMKFFNAVCV